MRETWFQAIRRATLVTLWIGALGLLLMVAALMWKSCWINGEYGTDIGFLAVGVGLVAAPFGYRRLFRPASRSTWRSWLVAVPLLATVIASLLVVLMIGTGSIKG